MDIEWFRQTCLAFPGTSEEIKWGNDLTFMVAGKMFLIVVLNDPLAVSFKVEPEEFDALSQSEGFIPAPYLARAQWVQLRDLQKISLVGLQAHITKSYQLIRNKLPKKLKLQHGLI